MRCFKRCRTVIWPSRRGVAALEFGIVAPVMLLMLLSTFELINVIRVQSKLNVAAGQLVEMIAGQSSVTEASPVGPGGTLGDMCTAASYNMLPFDRTKLSGWIESTTVVQPFGIQTSQDWADDQSCPSTTNRQGSFNETIALTNEADVPRSMFTVDGTPKQSGGTLVKGYSAISVQLTYVYTNILPFKLGRTITLTAAASARPRSNTTIPCTYPSGSTTVTCPGVY